MNTDKPPTKEELEATLQETIAAAEAPEPESTATPPLEEVSTTPPENTVPVTASLEQSTTPKTTESIKEEAKEPTVDYENRWKESARENQIIRHTQLEMEQQIDEAQSIATPSEKQLKEEFPEWDDLSDVEKRLATDNLHNKLINGKIREIRNSQKEAQSKLQERVDQIETFAINPDILQKYPKIEGKQEAFKIFATKPTRMTLDLEDAAALFSVGLPEQVKHTGQMFEQGSGGPNTPVAPKSNKISLEAAALVQQTDYNKWKELLQAGMIDTENVS